MVDHAHASTAGTNSETTGRKVGTNGKAIATATSPATTERWRRQKAMGRGQRREERGERGRDLDERSSESCGYQQQTNIKIFRSTDRIDIIHRSESLLRVNGRRPPRCEASRVETCAVDITHAHARVHSGSDRIGSDRIESTSVSQWSGAPFRNGQARHSSAIVTASAAPAPRTALRGRPSPSTQLHSHRRQR
jgi:hypothetical protein